MENFHDIEGLVLSSMDYKENNKIIKVFTKELGIISIMYKNKNKLFNESSLEFDLFSLSRFNLVKGKNFYYLQELDLIESNFFLRDDLKKNTYAIVMIDFIKNILYDEMPDDRIYELLKKAISILKFKDNVIDIYNGFLLKLSYFSGIQPSLKYCSICGKHLYSAGRFSIDMGGIICDNCISKNYYDMYLDTKDIEYLIYLIYRKFEDIKDYDINEEKKIQLRNLFSKFLIRKFEINEFNSLKFLNYID